MKAFAAAVVLLVAGISHAATPLPPRDAKYVMPDGSILIAGNDLMVPYMERLIALQYHGIVERNFLYELIVARRVS